MVAKINDAVGTDLRRTLLCYGVIGTQTGAGSWFIISYSTYFMIVAGLTVDEAFKFGIMNTALGFIGVNFGMYLMRHVMGRRTILMTGAIIQGAAMLGLAVSATVAPGTFAARSCLIAFIAIYLFSYNAFVGDAAYPTATELVSTRLRSWSVGSAISIGYFLAWLTSFFSPYFINPGNLNWVGDIHMVAGPCPQLLELTKYVCRAPSTDISGQVPTWSALRSFTSLYPRQKVEL